MKKALIVADSDISNNQRIKRQINAIENDYKVTVLLLNSSGGIKQKLYFITRFYEKYYWDTAKTELLKQLSNCEYDIIIANNITCLPFAIKLANKARVIFDAHEYHPEEFNDCARWRLLHKPYMNYLCKKYIVKCDLFTTVSQTIADKYMGMYKKKVYVITNACKYFELLPTTIGDKVKIIHHGAAIRSRKIESMVDMAMLLDERFEVYFMLTGEDKKYINWLKKYASRSNNIFFIPPVNSDEIVNYTNKFDIAIYILSPNNFNQLNALPNKLFEFIQARLCLIISPNPEMKSVVEKYKIGIVCNDYSVKNMAKTINCLSKEQVMGYKNYCNYAAKKNNSEKNKILFLDLINKINNIDSELFYKNYYF